MYNFSFRRIYKCYSFIWFLNICNNFHFLQCLRFFLGATILRWRRTSGAVAQDAATPLSLVQTFRPFSTGGSCCPYLSKSILYHQIKHHPFNHCHVSQYSMKSGKPMLPEDPLDSSSDWVCKETGEMKKTFQLWNLAYLRYYMLSSNVTYDFKTGMRRNAMEVKTQLSKIGQELEIMMNKVISLKAFQLILNLNT